MSKAFKGIKRVLGLYVKNVFDGRLTTLVGVFLIGFGVYQAVNGATFMEVSAYIMAGITIAGFKDPSIKGGPPSPDSKGKPESPASPEP